ncbi:MAG: alpha/beta fold hydrolase [Myxococcales bacterium]|nr:alpha/beta fold hydrolase [Myxococcales bacterium]
MRARRMRWLFATTLLCALCALGGSGCGEREAAPAAEPTVRVPERPAQTAPDPLRVTTPNGVTLVGNLWRGGRDRPAVVLLHQLGAERREWTQVAEALVRAGHTVVAYDHRGHGESRLGPGGALLQWRTFSDSEWTKLADDLDAVLEWLKRQPFAPDTFVLGGSSIGGSAAIVAASRRTDVAGVFVLSPGRAYRGVDVLRPAASVQAPLLAFVAEGEAPSLETAEDLARVAPRGRARVLEGSAHGLRMLPANPSLLAELVAFAASPREANEARPTETMENE